MRNLRATYRAILGVPFLLTAVFVMLPLQELLLGPVFKNESIFTGFVNKGLRGLFGLRVEFNKASAPIERNRKTWYVANHMSPADPFVVDKITDNKRFVAAGWLTQIPFVADLGKAARVIFVSQKKDERFKLQDRGKIVETFNEGKNVAMFPEGWTNDGATVELFRAGLAEVLYGGEAKDRKGNTVELQDSEKIVVQPIAIRVKSVDGEDALNNPELREAYSMHAIKNNLKRIWNRLGYEEIVLDITAFEPLEPKNFSDARSLMNEAHRQIVRVVAPDQTEVGKAPIVATEGEDKTVRPIDPPKP